MTTLRVGVVGGLTDDEIIAIRRRVRPDLSDGALWTDTLAFAREVERMGTRSLRDRVRELEATQRTFGTQMHATMERAERAEAKLASAEADVDRVEAERDLEILARQDAWGQTAIAQAERDALRTAARAVIDRWDTPLWKEVQPTAESINRLRAALAGEKHD